MWLLSRLFCAHVNDNMFQDDQDDVRIKECEQEFFEMVSACRFTSVFSASAAVSGTMAATSRAAPCCGVLMSNLSAQVGSSMQKAEEASE
jgi:hypothetical protein